MNANQREQVRLSLVRFLDANAGRRFGLSNGVLRQMLAAEGLEAEAAELEAELRYLEDKGLIARRTKTLSPELAIWDITAAGRDFFAQMS